MSSQPGDVSESRRLFETTTEYTTLLKKEPAMKSLGSPGRRRTDKLTTWTALSYALPSLALAAQYLPTHIHVFKFYTDSMMVPAGDLAVGTAVARAVDCLIDPLIGWISDNTESPWGRRKPYILCSLPINAFAYFLLFSPAANTPPADATHWFTFFYFLYLAVPLALPYNSLGPELSADNKDRVRMFMYAEVCDKIGIIFASMLPSALIFLYNGNIMLAYSESAMIISAITMIAFSILLVVVQEPERQVERIQPVRSSQFVPGIRRAMRNSPYRLLMYAASMGSLSHAITNVTLAYYLACVIQVDKPEEFIGNCLCAFFIPAALSVPLWQALSHWLDTRRAWLIGWGLHVPVCAAMFALGPGDIEPFMVLTVLIGISYGAMFLSKAMISDSIDYQELRTGKRSEGQFLAWMTLVPKLAVIPASSLPLVILSSTGYVPNVAQQNESVTMALKVMFSLFPCILSTITFIIAYQYPITRAVQERIQRMIATRNDDNQILIDPISGLPFALQHGFSMDMDHFSADELQILADPAGWRQLHQKLIQLLVLSATVLIISCAIVIAQFAEALTVTATCTASMSAMMIAYEGFRLRALYDFTDESQIELKSTLEQLLRHHE